ncbi:MAG: response regulator transcription factor [Clostridium sp.]|nr:response regulator transcription factor [Clostridium sp.]
MSKILIIEDDENILQLERDYLEANSFETDFAVDGETGAKKAIENKYDLILLDIMLPGLDGFEICKRIRAEKNIPILLVSAKKSDMDKINGLSFGADDYIIKPFSPSELVARVKAHISRYQRLTNTPEPSILTLGNLTLNKDSGEVFLNGTEITLTKKEFEVLFLLASKPDTVFSKNDLFEQIWGYDSLGDTSTLTVHINRLRDKLKETDPDSDYIKTVWGRGYRLK